MLLLSLLLLLKTVKSIIIHKINTVYELGFYKTWRFNSPIKVSIFFEMVTIRSFPST